MILEYCGNKTTKAELLQQVNTKSVWTIDLVHLIHKLGCTYEFYTAHAGVRDNYLDFNYYQAEFNNDKARVCSLFSCAEEQGIIVNERIVTMAEIQQHVSQADEIAIILIDAAVLRRLNKSYCGHYIILLSYHEETKEFTVCDPSLPEKVQFSCDIIEEARLASGTDQDIIFLKAQEHQ